MMRLAVDSDIHKVINRGDIFYCRLNSPNDEELKHNQFLIGKIRPCLIIGDGNLTFPFLEVIPIRSDTDSEFFNKENSFPIKLEKEYESFLDFSQMRPVHYKNIFDYIGTIHNQEMITEIEKRITRNYGFEDRVIFIEPGMEGCKEKLENVVNTVLKGLKECKDVNIQIGYINRTVEWENDDEQSNNEQIEKRKRCIPKVKRVYEEPNENKYKEMDEKQRTNLVLNYSSLLDNDIDKFGYLGKRFGFSSMYELSTNIHNIRKSTNNI